MSVWMSRLAKELARIAAVQGMSESEVARTLLGYGIEVVRRLEVQRYSDPFEWARRREDPDERWPTTIEVEARERPMTDEEVDRAGLRGFVGYYPDDRPWED
jgi:hypothetical protein